ncbi:hypothetical protein RchiOBHm_Chr2g0110031 [Rosa chinensis]|uniref:Uncharacterized protein n=1 Tax=Rosa chinensis TaxID=74649 RepID=A0A2P6RPL7_ROSCH|nr:hypothetical protein RchiOBHm_Chr2g0110031 [Rosa chinensis]
MLHAKNSSSPIPDPPWHTVPDSAGTVEHAQILSRLSTYGFSQLFIRDKQLMIEEMMSMNELQGIVIKTPAEAELILWFWQLCSTDQQRLINNMFDDVNYCQVDIGDSAVDRLPDESEAFIRLGTFTELLATFPWHWEGFSRLWELSGDDQSRYAEFFLGLSTFCIRTQCSDDAEDQVALVLEKFGCDVIQKLPYESEEDFRVRRFKDSFTKLQFSSQLCIVSQLLEELEKN